MENKQVRGLNNQNTTYQTDHVCWIDWIDTKCIVSLCSPQPSHHANQMCKICEFCRYMFFFQPQERKITCWYVNVIHSIITPCTMNLSSGIRALLACGSPVVTSNPFPNLQASAPLRSSQFVQTNQYRGNFLFICSLADEKQALSLCKNTNTDKYNNRMVL